ncbi:MAG: DEAD/DEAH box helicase, partial [Porticoccaceae bacterium]
MSDWYFYLLRCADGSLYSGITTDIERRVREHNQGTAGARYTRGRRPVSLAYSERLPDRAQALRREYAVKRLDRAAKLQLLANATSLPDDLYLPDNDDMSFATLGLIEPLQRALAELEHRTPTPIQRQAIPPVLAGRDLIAAAQTGSGKTASFALPLLQKLSAGTPASSNCIRALVLVPTRELAQQVADNLKTYGRHLSLRITVAYGGTSLNPQMMALRRGAEILVATPGRLLDLCEKNAVKFHELHMLVLDEADRMLDMGFRRELEEILTLLPRRRQTLLFSATFSDAIRELAAGLLDKPQQIDASPRNTTVGTVKQWLIPVDKQRKLELFCHLLRKRHWPRVLVFAKTRKRVDELVTSLKFQNIGTDAIHGDITQAARLAALRRFQAGTVRVLVATDVAARGLDISALPLVVNLDLPVDPEGYVHRVGRTARAGAAGEAISLVCA